MNNIPTPTFCANHPNIETSLRCNRCEKYICPKCAIATPTGYRCRECVRGQQKTFETATWLDYVLGGLFSAIIALIGSFIVPALGFFTLLLTPVVGVVIAEVSRVITQKRRSSKLFRFLAIATLLGCLPVLLYSLTMFIFFLTQGSFSSFWSLLWKVVYTFTLTSTVYYRLSGIQIHV